MLHCFAHGPGSEIAFDCTRTRRFQLISYFRQVMGSLSRMLVALIQAKARRFVSVSAPFRIMRKAPQARRFARSVLLCSLLSSSTYVDNKDAACLRETGSLGIVAWKTMLDNSI